MEIFTLTPLRQAQGKLRASSGQALALSLKEEGIAELRKSYPESLLSPKGHRYNTSIWARNFAELFAEEMS